MDEPNYFQAVVDALGEHLPTTDIGVLRFYALLVLTRGVNTSLEDVHQAWAAWRSYTRPDHPDLIPFDELPAEVQEYDRKYMVAVHQVARAVA